MYGYNLTFCYVMLSYVILCYAMLCSLMQRNATQCNAILCYVCVYVYVYIYIYHIVPSVLSGEPTQNISYMFRGDLEGGLSRSPQPPILHFRGVPKMYLSVLHGPHLKSSLTEGVILHIYIRVKYIYIYIYTYIYICIYIICIYIYSNHHIV